MVDKEIAEALGVVRLELTSEEQVVGDEKEGECLGWYFTGKKCEEEAMVAAAPTSIARPKNNKRIVWLVSARIKK